MSVRCCGVARAAVVRGRRRARVRVAAPQLADGRLRQLRGDARGLRLRGGPAGRAAAAAAALLARRDIITPAREPRRYPRPFGCSFPSYHGFFLCQLFLLLYRSFTVVRS